VIPEVLLIEDLAVTYREMFENSMWPVVGCRTAENY